MSDDICMEFWIDKWENYIQERKIISLAKFSTWHQYINTRAWTGKNIKVPREGEKWRYDASTCDRNFEEGILEEKEWTEIPVERK